MIADLCSGVQPIDTIRRMKLSNFFLQSYSSYLFNMALSSLINKKYRNVKLVKLGKGSRLNRLTRSLYCPILKRERVSLKEFESCAFDLKAHSRDSLFYPSISTTISRKTALSLISAWLTASMLPWYWIF